MKCSFLADVVDYIDLVIRPRHLNLASHTTDVIRALEPPTSISELKSFLGIGNVFQQFFLHFARIAALLNERLKKYQPATSLLISSKELDATEILK